MNVEPWVLIAIGAALAQTLRNTLAQTISSRITATLNSWSRFTFCLPFATIAAILRCSGSGGRGMQLR